MLFKFRFLQYFRLNVFYWGPRRQFSTSNVVHCNKLPNSFAWRSSKFQQPENRFITSYFRFFSQNFLPFSPGESFLLESQPTAIYWQIAIRHGFFCSLGGATGGENQNMRQVTTFFPESFIFQCRFFCLFPGMEAFFDNSFQFEVNWFFKKFFRPCIGTLSSRNIRKPLQFVSQK